ncbi:MAG: preprotein translocase subunit SecA [Bdellovibrionaceae bacterium]|nr:preprotein translocase subunit SecA [Bdellovibrio sp.]
MIQKILAKIFGTKHEREMKKIQPLVEQINSFEANIQKLSDAELQAKTPELKKRLANGETVDAILPEAFAVCREASKRVLGMRHYDVQMIGGVILNRGSIAEMRTGEGKTLVATLPVFLNALSGKGVHVVTVNDYLATRDCEWMSQLYNWLGLSTGVIKHGLTDDERRAAYNADITYATNNELGFDYLRDNMKFDLSEYVQRAPHFAIVDECDSILVDEARTPLIISGPAEASTDKYYTIDKIIPLLKRDVHFAIEEKSKSATLTEEGNSEVEKLLKLDNLYDPANIELLHHVNQALRAHHLYRLDVEYMIKDGEVIIVDEFTGRLMPGRRWSDGLHQAIEAKEKVEVKNENQTLATITFQNYFRMYDKLSGMTGTADTEAVEFRKIYNLGVNVIPTNKPVRRNDVEDIVYKTEQAKFKAITNDIKERHAKGQPVLVGTASIEKSESLSRWLKTEGVRHDVLNAKHHEREAEIVALAGRKGAVTIATNMAGRGTDIMLGGNAEVLAKKTVAVEEGPEFEAAVAKFKGQTESEKKEVIAAGGLYIVGTERHESRRIDNQLRGRSGRQGDPGESRFYLSLEDNLMRIFNGERIQKIMTMLNIPEDEPITHKMVTNAIEGAQRKVEGHHFDVRKHLLDYDNVMNMQRNAIYKMRRQILEGKEIERSLLDMLGDVVSVILDTHVPQDAKAQDWNLEGLNTALMAQFGFQIELKPSITSAQIQDEITTRVKKIFEHQKQSMGPYFEQISKMVMLNAIDQRWKEHLYTLDKVKEGINLRAYGQKDPLIEYKKEAFKAFEYLSNIIKSETIEKMMRVQLVSGEMEDALEKMRPQDADVEGLNYSAPSDSDDSFSDMRPATATAHATPEPPPKRRLMAGPPSGGGADSEKSLNRAERRRQKGR